MAESDFGEKISPASRLVTFSISALSIGANQTRARDERNFFCCVMFPLRGTENTLFVISHLRAESELTKASQKQKAELLHWDEQEK